MCCWRAKQSKLGIDSATFHRTYTVRISLLEEPDELESTESDNTVVGKQDLGKSKTPLQPPEDMQAPRPVPRYPWSQRTLNVLEQSPSPIPRYGHTLSVISEGGDGVWLFGGVSDGALTSDVYVLNIQDGAVKRRHTEGTKPTPRMGHAAVVVKVYEPEMRESIIVWGGQANKRDSDLYVFDISSLIWSRLRWTGHGPTGRVGHTLTADGCRLFMFGGDVEGRPSDELWVCDIDASSHSATWGRISRADDMVWPPARVNHTCILHEEHIYLFGGTDYQYHYNDTWMFSIVSHTWVELNVIGYLPDPSEGHSAALVGDHMYVYGGRDVNAVETYHLGALDIPHCRWYMFQRMGRGAGPRADHAVAAVGSEIIILGGEPRSYEARSANRDEEKKDQHIMHVLDTGCIKYPDLPRKGTGTNHAQ
ncbi:galactose oxidase [Obba rivulosa]|uniref:Galactose oxidase n=1 Tax=Obba rivulosa TaxID=1052685 RepID=A0A8E2DS90_9APHY|nr:galactose oxidase [Obba rivulosa]